MLRLLNDVSRCRNSGPRPQGEAALHRYYFNLDGASLPDINGVELPDLRSAASGNPPHGRTSARQPEAFWEHPEWQLTVTDEARLVLFTVHVLATDAPALTIEVVPQP